MNNSYKNADFLVKIQQIEDYLTSCEMNYKFFKKSSTLPTDTLLIYVGEYPDKSPRTINLNFLPTPQNTVLYTDFIQFIQVMPCTLNQRNRPNIEKLLTLINLKLSLGSYVITPENQILLRYVFPVPSDNIINKNLFIETLKSYSLMGNLFNNYILSVIDGKSDLSEIFQKINVL